MMKRFTIILFMISVLASCDLVQVVDVEPKNALTEQGLFESADGAERALAGVYNGLTEGSLDYWTQIVSMMGVEAMGTNFLSVFSTNSVPADNFLNNSTYQGFYQIANRASYVIENVEGMNENLFGNKSKQAILAEARFLRAFSHLGLLQTYGQFWDLDSPYGIVLRKEGGSIIHTGRSTVAQTYAFILEDLNYAIDNLSGQANPLPYYANLYAAIALKAKVKLYMGDFSEAATLAGQVINEGPFALEENYEDIFTEQRSSEEMVFCTFDDADDEYNYTVQNWGSFLLLSPVYEQVASNENDTRFDIIANGPAPNIKFSKGIITTGFNNTQYFLRLAEVYLIYAEALARSGGPLTDTDSEIDDVEDALNAIRNRAGMPDTTASDKPGFLEAIRIEKLLELATETGEPWRDMIRYSVLDGLDISAIKPGIISENQYILPIPNGEIVASDGSVAQNPGY